MSIVELINENSGLSSKCGVNFSCCNKPPSRLLLTWFSNSLLVFSTVYKSDSVCLSLQLSLTFLITCSTHLIGVSISWLTLEVTRLSILLSD